MTRHFTRASNQSFEASSLTLPAPPYTIACHFNLDTLQDVEALWAIDDVTTGYDFVAVTAAGVLRDQITDNSTCTISGVVAGKWHTAVLVCAATNSRTIYLDGKPGTTNTNTESRTFTHLLFGGYGSSNASDGIVATPAIWNCALIPSEVLAFASGVHPTRIRPANLWMPPGNFDALMAGGPVMQSRRGAFAFTNNNAVGISNLAPPVEPEFLPRRRRRLASGAAGRVASIAVTEANDTAALVALHSGSLLASLVEANDSASISAHVRHLISIAATEAADSAAIVASSGIVSLKIPVIAPYKSDDTIGTKTLQVYVFSGGSLVTQGSAQTTGFTALPNITNGWMVTVNVVANGGFGDFCGLAVFSNITPSSGSQNARAVPLYSTPRSFPSSINIVAVKQFDDADTIVTPGYQLYDIDRNAVGSHVTSGIVAPAGTSKCYATKLTLTPDAYGGTQNWIEWDSG